MVEHCPVCDSRINDTVPTAGAEYDGEEYHFESAKCKEFFEASPDEYT
ncbi:MULTISPECIES: YHS domain-containing protein [Halorussus]|nr:MULTISPECIES: YHS domain-containing protein [Halorussus]NHN60684.1 YHS domain-containing protein [Halorussus sp. JP-T4]